MPLCLGFTLAAPATIAIDELRPGMTGFGLSVFAPGGRVDTFAVELVDVMRNVAPQSDLILVRCSGQGLEHSGIVAGMSGSPVYFEGRLAGALAYGWGFAKDPVGGVTPIAEMLALLDLPDPPPASPRSGVPGPSPGLSARFAQAGLPARCAQAGPAGSLPRLRLPLGIAGGSRGLPALAAPLIEEAGFLPVAAGAVPGAGPRSPGSSFEPGSAVCVLLADGDFTAAAVGTVTWVEGDRLLAFGHPMFQAGPAAMPMAPAEVHAVVASYASSIKLFSPGPPVGTVVQDRATAISGVVGPAAPMFPVRVSLATPGLEREYRYRVARVGPLVPVIAAIGVADVVYATEGVHEEATLEADVRLKLAGRPALALRHVFTSRAPAALLAGTLADRLRLLLENRFEPVEVESITVALDLRPGLRRLTITGARPSRTTVAPGETLSLWLSLRDDAGRASSRRFSVTIPPTAPAGRLALAVSSADSALLRDLSRAQGAAEPRSLAELADLLEKTGNEDELVIAGYSSAPGLALGTRELPAAPPTLLGLLGSGRRLRLAAESRLFVVRERLDGVIAGSHEVLLEVKR
ncbi:MAG: SpoIVB peptidase S55 domain-containing protein [bacterium]